MAQVYRFRHAKVSYNFHLLARDFDGVIFVWDRHNVLSLYLDVHGTAVTPELDAFMAAAFKSGLLLPFSSFGCAARLVYGSACNGLASFQPSVKYATGVFGTMDDFLHNFPLVNTFLEDATTKTYKSSGWNIALNKHSRQRAVAFLGDDAKGGGTV